MRKLIAIPLCLFPLLFMSHCGTGSGGTVLDTTFGTSGKVTTAFTGQAEADALAVQSDGSIIAAGYASNSGNQDFALARYTSDGVLDTTFNATGKVTVDFGGGTDAATAVAVQSDGKIVVAGKSNPGSGNVFALARLASDGSLDTTFGSSGLTLTTVGTDDEIFAIALQADSKIVVAGRSKAGATYNFAVARYTTAGALDPTFNSNGKLTFAVGTGNSRANAIALQTDGSIVVAGQANTGIDRFGIARITTLGALDTTYGTAGKSTYGISSGSNDAAYGVAIDSANRAILVGNTDTSPGKMEMMRVDSLGTLDSTFGTIGRLAFLYSTGVSSGRAVLVNSNSSYLAVGTSAGTTDDFGVARIGFLGNIDSTLNGTGYYTLDFDSSTDQAFAIVRTSSDRVVVAGRSLSGSTYVFALAKLRQ